MALRRDTESPEGQGHHQGCTARRPARANHVHPLTAPVCLGVWAHLWRLLCLWSLPRPHPDQAWLPGCLSRSGLRVHRPLVCEEAGQPQAPLPRLSQQAACCPDSGLPAPVPPVAQARPGGVLRANGRTPDTGRKLPSHRVLESESGRDRLLSVGSSWLCLHTSRDGDLTTSGAAPTPSFLPVPRPGDPNPPPLHLAFVPLAS